MSLVQSSALAVVDCWGLAFSVLVRSVVNCITSVRGSVLFFFQYISVKDLTI